MRVAGEAKRVSVEYPTCVPPPPHPSRFCRFPVRGPRVSPRRAVRNRGPCACGRSSQAHEPRLSISVREPASFFSRRPRTARPAQTPSGTFQCESQIYARTGGRSVRIVESTRKSGDYRSWPAARGPPQRHPHAYAAQDNARVGRGLRAGRVRQTKMRHPVDPLDRRPTPPTPTARLNPGWSARRPERRTRLTIHPVETRRRTCPRSRASRAPHDGRFVRRPR